MPESSERRTGPNGRPLVCRYCDGQGNSKAGGDCGFCEGGEPLDTQEDWDRSWGSVLGRKEPDRA